MPKFYVTEHKVGTRSWDWGGHKALSHTLELIGEGGAPGETHRAILVFDAMIDADRLGSAVGYMTGQVETGASIVGWFPLEMFATYLELLADDELACLHFELRDAEAGQGYLKRLGIGRADKVRRASTRHIANRIAAPTAYAMPL
jgi:hypothetical protein